MIKVGDKYLRNLEEQVQYLTNYHDVNQGLVQWGIRVVGQVEVEGDLPLPYDGEYGDAIAVGKQAPFFFYIWTRASIEGGNAYWFPFGEISTVGPVGPVGPKGEKGDTGYSTMWYSGSDVPNSSSQVYVDGDMYLQTNGQVYKYQNGSWQSVVNIRGPQGIQGIQGIQGPQGLRGILGPKGDRGDVGGFINIKGILPDVNRLPLPSALSNLSVAYLIGASEPYDLYIQVGNTSEDAIWTNTGPFNAATMVTVDGEYQNIWDADVKVNKSELNNYISKADFNLENGEGIDSIVLRYSGEVDGTHFGNTNTGESAAVFGESNNNYAKRALLAGKLNNNNGSNSIVGGLRNTVEAPHGITIGSSNTVELPAIRSVTAGYNNINSGEDSIQTGTSNNNYGIGSAEFGSLNINHGNYSALIGYQNINNGNYSALIGVNLRNEQQNEDGTYNTKVIIGRWNLDGLDNIFEIGNGESNSKRSNAFEVLRDGHAQAGRSTINTDNGLTLVTKDYADTKLEKDTSSTTYNQVYVKAADGGQGSINVTKQAIADCVVQRKGDGNITVPQAPTSYLDAVSKYYVDKKVTGIFTLDGTTLTITTS